MNEIIRSKLLVFNDEKSKSVISTQNVTEKSKVFGLYFSASYCPPCHKFTPLLKSVYIELQPKGLEIILVPSDKTRPAFEDYFKSMPWLSLPYDNDIALNNNSFGASIRSEFNVASIPTLIFFDNEGKIITRDGRVMVQNYGVEELCEKLGL